MRYLTATFILFLAVAATLTASPVSAQAPGAQGAPVFAVLDIGKIRRDAASVKSIREQIISYQNKLQGELQKEQDALRTAQQELAKKQTLLAPEAFADERQKFEQRVVSVQQMVQERRRNLEEIQTNAMLKVEQSLNEIVASMAEKNGYDVIFRLSQVVFVKTSLDITADVLKELDKKLPTVKVEIPK
ncbi:MAG: OmpH family outer membrane protein [Rhodospirillales bacterium]